MATTTTTMMLADLGTMRARTAARIARELAEGNRAGAEIFAAENPVEYDAIDVAYSDGWAIGREMLMHVRAPSGMGEYERRAWENGLAAGRLAYLRDEAAAMAREWQVPGERDIEGNDHAGSVAGHPADGWEFNGFASEGR